VPREGPLSRDGGSRRRDDSVARLHISANGSGRRCAMKVLYVATAGAGDATRASLPLLHRGDLPCAGAVSSGGQRRRGGWDEAGLQVRRGGRVRSRHVRRPRFVGPIEVLRPSRLPRHEVRGRDPVQGRRRLRAHALRPGRIIPRRALLRQECRGGSDVPGRDREWGPQLRFATFRKAIANFAGLVSSASLVLRDSEFSENGLTIASRIVSRASATATGRST
jgi:hypothetical protein